LDSNRFRITFRRGIDVQNFIQAMWHAVRIYRKSPTTTAIAVGTLALGIAAVVTGFSLVNAVLLKPLQYPDADRIVLPWRQAPSGMDLGHSEIPWGTRDYMLLREQIKSFQFVSAFKGATFNLTGTGDPQPLEGLRVSPQFFSVFGVSPMLGGGFTALSDEKIRHDEVVLSYKLWLSRFGGLRSIIGRTIDLNGVAFSVVGVMPRGFAAPRAAEMPGSFQFPKEPQLWVRLAPQPVSATPGGLYDLAVIARVKKGFTLDHLRQELSQFAQSQDLEFPKYKGWFISRLETYHQQVTGDTRTPLLLSLGAVSIVLLIACANLANLLMAQSFSRKREFAVRTALGATRRRIVAQVIAESLVLAIAGGILGTVLAFVAMILIKTSSLATIPRLEDLGIDLRVYGFALAVSLGTGAAAGLLPALWASSTHIFASLKEGGQRSVGSGHNSFKRAFLIGEVGLSLVLVVAGGLLIRTFTRLMQVDPGFDATRILTFQAYLPGTTYPSQKAEVQFLHTMLHRLQETPGVNSVGLIPVMPMGGAPESTVIRFLDRPFVEPHARPMADYSIVSPGYFKTMGISLMRGRDITEQDDETTPKVTIINQEMARKFWPDSDPIGKQIDFGTSAVPPLTIIGVVENVKHASMRELAGPEIYVPYTQNPWSSMQTMQFAVQTTRSAEDMKGVIERAVHSIDAGMPIAKLTTLRALVDDSMSDSRFAMIALGGFSLLSLILASIGLYGTMSYSVQQRTQEIGVRMALGAQRSGIFRLVILQAVGTTCAGIAIGLVIAVSVAFAMRRFLYGISTIDPLTFLTAPVILLAVTILASYMPSRRATQVDPMVSLRND
jgi:predicted permease